MTEHVWHPRLEEWCYNGKQLHVCRIEKGSSSVNTHESNVGFANCQLCFRANLNLSL